MPSACSAHYGVLGPADVWAKTASAAASAVMLDALSAEAHTSLAHVHATQDWDWPGAEREYLHSIRLNPRYPTAHHWYAMSCLVPMGRLDAAMEQMQIAQALDPVSSIISRDLAVIHCYRRDFDRALDQCDHTVELNPHFAAAYLTLGLVQEQRREFDESAAAFRRAVDLAPRSPRMHAALARTYALSDRLDQAHEELDALRALAATRYVSPFDFVLVHLGMGELRRGPALAGQGLRRPLLRAAGAGRGPALRCAARLGRVRRNDLEGPPGRSARLGGGRPGGLGRAHSLRTHFIAAAYICCIHASSQSWRWWPRVE